MARNDIKNSSLLKTKFLIYAFNGRTLYNTLRYCNHSKKNEVYLQHINNIR